MDDCIFCNIANGKSPAKIEYESADWVVFYDINPSAPKHLLIVPKKHLQWDKLFSDMQQVLGEVFLLAPEVAEQVGIKDSGYKIVMNCGRGAGQIVDHFHVHLIGGWTDGSHHSLP